VSYLTSTVEGFKSSLAHVGPFKNLIPYFCFIFKFVCNKINELTQNANYKFFSVVPTWGTTSSVFRPVRQSSSVHPISKTSFPSVRTLGIDKGNYLTDQRISFGSKNKALVYISSPHSY